MPRLAWVRAVLQTWNAVAPALHMHGIDIYDERTRRMPWGALLARIEHLYHSEPMLRALVDDAVKEGT